MNSKGLLLMIASMAASPWAGAADSAKPALPDKAVQPFQLKNKSAFVPNGISRNPFVPIGYKALVTNVAAPAAVQRQTADEGMFRVSSILIGSPSIAVINGRAYEEGQMIRMPKSGLQIRAKVFRIGDGAVQIQAENEILTVPLRRGELNEKKPDEPLSSDKE